MVGALRAVAVACVLGAAGGAQATPRAELPVEQLRKAVSEWQAAKGVPGISVSVRTLDGAAWAQGFGAADLENAVAVTPESRYRLASVSKTISAITALRLAEQGKVDLDERIQTYCPAFPDKSGRITLRLLLGHRAGVRHYKDDAEIGSTKHYASTVDALAMFKDDPLVAEPGARFEYSTFGYTLIACALEGATHKDFVTLVRELVWEPAGMTGARADDVFDLIPHRTYGYVKKDDGTLRNSDLADTSYKIAGGGMVATADDLTRFAQALIGGKLVGAETTRTMWAEQTPATGEATGYGLGWILGARDGMREVFHTGSQQRVSTVVYMLPDLGVAVAVLSNLEDSKAASLARRLADIILGRDKGADGYETPELAAPWYERVKS